MNEEKNLWHGKGRRVKIQLHYHDGTVWQGHGVWDENYPDWRPEIIAFYNFLVLQDGNWLREKSAKIERLSALGRANSEY
jgi:hypothetical protein